ncbi:metallo-mystery pair system four-Cys motif protein [Chromobacterium sp. ATCC 53434]|uniref:MbnP family copper-binding protein n=1 Tax=Chromobacterium sp. (strain ATCC 53434 / SC 14030) TaxID=2059672 RepID=UPI000C75F6BD|nr:MbnP family copper-binding protein [Chromobacterium sp. ATCC 53434]AUH49585.1 metallo-mystery pair system four-Cys motif protein [Chromobacterium sp. ATCC 53434]
MKRNWILVPGLCLGLAACLGGGVKSSGEQGQDAARPDPGYGGGDTTVRFALKAGGQPVACHTRIAGIGSGQATATLAEGMLYVHDVALINNRGQEVPLRLDQGSKWQYLNLALLDFAGGSCKDPARDDGDTPVYQPLAGGNSEVVGSVPADSYTGLSFRVGVPVSAKNAKGEDVALNHQPAHSPPHPILGIYWLMWEWQSGHRFMRVDLAPEGGVRRAGGGTSDRWAFHLGSTDCQPDAAAVGGYRCGKPNRFKVAFDRFDPKSDQVVLDLQSLFAGNDIGRDDSADFGCKSNATDAECRPIFERLGLRLNDSAPGAGDGGLPLDDGRHSRVFRLEKTGR